MQMTEVAERLVALREEKDNHESYISELKKRIEQAEYELLSEMISEEVGQFSHLGKLFSIRTQTYGSAIPEAKAELYSALKENGYEDLFSVNSSTLSGFIKEQAAQNDGNVPEFLEGLVTVYEKQSISIRNK